MKGILFVTFGVAATLQTALPSSTGGKKDQSTASPKRVICVESAPTGSRIPGRRVCREAGEWEQDRIQAQEGTERAQRTNIIHGN